MSDLCERRLGFAEAGALLSLKEERRPSRLRGGVVGMDGLLGTGFVSMCSCGRADVDRGGEEVERIGEFDVSGGEAGGGASVEEDWGEGGGGEDILSRLMGKLEQSFVSASNCR
jgi:hypothetical protein